MDLYLVRHAIAMDWESFSGDDSERPLTPEGKEKMARIARGLRSLKPGFEVLLTSPYRRAQETAEILAAEFHLNRQLHRIAHLEPDGGPDALIQKIKEDHGLASSVALVGHEPYLSQFAATLIFGKATAGIRFKKGGVLKMTVNRLRFGQCAELDWLLTPRQLIALAS